MSKTKKRPETNQKLFQTALAAFILILVVLLIKQLPYRPTQNPSSTLPKKGVNHTLQIEISGVKVNDFYKTAPASVSESYVSIVRNKKYHVFYIPEFELFVISIGSRPFDELQKIAEQDLLEKLGVSQEEACKLNINITTPSFANPDKAGEIYELSFCE